MKLAEIATKAKQEAERQTRIAAVQQQKAEQQAEIATRQTRIATSRPLAALSVAERDKSFDRSRLLAVAALQCENTLEARDSLYNALQGRPELTSFLHTHEGHVWSVVWSVAFSPDGKTIAAGYGGGVDGGGGVVLWDVAARKRLVDDPLPVKEGSVQSVAFSPDGKTIAAGFYGGGVVLWDVAARKRLVDEPLSVTEGEVRSVSFSPDGKTIAAGYVGQRDKSGVVLWDMAARKRLVDKPLPVIEGKLESVAFSPDGKTIAAGFHVVGAVGGVVLWDVDLETWQRRAGQIANRNFTREEWRDYFPETPYHATFPDLPVPPEVTPK